MADHFPLMADSVAEFAFEIGTFVAWSGMGAGMMWLDTVATLRTAAG